MDALTINPSHSSLLDALNWIVAAFLGSVATAIAVLAVAGVGFLAIAGRIELRRATSVVLGCFILFGAHSIAAGLLSFAQGEPGGPDIYPQYHISNLSRAVRLHWPDLAAIDRSMVLSNPDVLTDVRAVYAIGLYWIRRRS